MKEMTSYRDILRSSSVVGGTHAVNYLIALMRVKIIAILLGPDGVGLISLYTSIIALLGAVSGLGIGSSGVREIVRAYSKDDAIEAARTVRILRRSCWATGLFGWLLVIAFAEPISNWMTGSSEHVSAIRILGSTLLIGAISSGQIALLQGLRRIGDLACVNVAGSLIGSLVSIAIYVFLGVKGVVPSLIVTAIIALAVSWWFSKRVPVERCDLPWADAIDGFKRLFGLGLAFMWSAGLLAGVDMLTRSFIAHEFGIESAGVYQAAWALSVMFAGFVLSAMGADFYPRLTAVIHNKPLAIRVVNEQIEIGVLLALPGILGIIAFSPVVVKMLYSPQFLPAAELVPWLTLGVFGRVISWPLGFVQLALGASRWFVATETAFLCLQAASALWLLQCFGMVGVAYAFAISYAIHVVFALWLARRLIGFSCSSDARSLIATASVFVGAVLAFRSIPIEIFGRVTETAAIVAGTVFSLRGLVRRLGSESPFSKRLSSVPGGSWLFSEAGGSGSGK